MNFIFRNPILISITMGLFFSTLQYKFHDLIFKFITVFFDYTTISKLYGILIKIPVIGFLVGNFFEYHALVLYIFPMFLISTFYIFLIKKKMKLSYIIAVSLIFSVLLYFPRIYPLYSPITGLEYVFLATFKQPSALFKALVTIFQYSLICFVALVCFNTWLSKIYVKLKEKKNYDIKNFKIVIIVTIILLSLSLFPFINTVNYMTCDPKLFDILIKPKDLLSEYKTSSFMDKGRYGFKDLTGEIVIEPKYKNTRFFSEGLAAVTIDGRTWGFINKKGEIVIEPKFEYANMFNEGLAAIKINNQFGYIDKSGKIIIEPKFKYANMFNKGVASVLLNGKYGYINRSGKIIIEPKFVLAKSFNEGIAGVKLNDKYAYIDKNGKIIITLEQGFQPFSFFNNQATIYNFDSKEWHKIDKTGKKLCGGKLPNH